MLVLAKIALLGAAIGAPSIKAAPVVAQTSSLVAGSYDGSVKKGLSFLDGEQPYGNQRDFSPEPSGYFEKSLYLYKPDFGLPSGLKRLEPRLEKTSPADLTLKGAQPLQLPGVSEWRYPLKVNQKFRITWRVNNTLDLSLPPIKVYSYHEAADTSVVPESERDEYAQGKDFSPYWGWSYNDGEWVYSLPEVTKVDRKNVQGTKLDGANIGAAKASLPAGYGVFSGNWKVEGVDLVESAYLFYGATIYEDRSVAFDFAHGYLMGGFNGLKQIYAAFLNGDHAVPILTDEQLGAIYARNAWAIANVIGTNNEYVDQDDPAKTVKIWPYAKNEYFFAAHFIYELKLVMNGIKNYVSLPTVEEKKVFDKSFVPHEEKGDYRSIGLDSSKDKVETDIENCLEDDRPALAVAGGLAFLASIFLGPFAFLVGAGMVLEMTRMSSNKCLLQSGGVPAEITLHRDYVVMPDFNP